MPSAAKFHDPFHDKTDLQHMTSYSIEGDQTTIGITQPSNVTSSVEVRTPMEVEKHVPVFSGRLGKDPTIKRTFSLESIETKLSLLTCSMNNDVCIGVDAMPLRRRKCKPYVRQTVTASAEVGIWQQLCNEQRGGIGKVLRQRNIQADVFGNTDKYVRHVTKVNNMYDYLDKDEATALYNSRFTKGLHCAQMKKSNSVTNITASRTTSGKVVSAGSRRRLTMNSVDFENLKSIVKIKRNARDLSRAMQRRVSDLSAMPTYVSDKELLKQTDIKDDSDELIDLVKDYSTNSNDKKIIVWQEEILEVDLKKELTDKVKQKIETTTAALERVTGHGDLNEARTDRECQQEYPMFVHDDYCKKPKMPQRIRISPDLSRVIKEDIRVRMGRPRYHEIRTTDIEVWNGGHRLNRSHRNLKVFNWLHSLREEEFEEETLQVLNDVPPGKEQFDPSDIVHIESCDEPRVTSLYRQDFQRQLSGR